MLAIGLGFTLAIQRSYRRAELRRDAETGDGSDRPPGGEGESSSAVPR